MAAGAALVALAVVVAAAIFVAVGSGPCQTVGEPLDVLFVGGKVVLGGHEPQGHYILNRHPVLVLKTCPGAYENAGNLIGPPGATNCHEGSVGIEVHDDPGGKRVAFSDQQT